jgi:hypothetical protein
MRSQLGVAIGIFNGETVKKIVESSLIMSVKLMRESIREDRRKFDSRAMLPYSLLNDRSSI